jgi:hypothetical protein
MTITIAEIGGWIGSILYVIAYLLLALKKLDANNPLYHLLNILGAVGLIINAFHWGDLPSVAVNIVWMIIGSFALLMIIRERRNRAA